MLEDINSGQSFSIIIINYERIRILEKDRTLL
jgi:hypothetical protein